MLLSVKIFAGPTSCKLRVCSTHFRCEHHGQALFSGIFFKHTCPASFSTGTYLSSSVFGKHYWCCSRILKTCTDVHHFQSKECFSALQHSLPTRIQTERFTRHVSFKMMLTPDLYCKKLLGYRLMTCIRTQEFLGYRCSNCERPDHVLINLCWK